jgi:hypothetical protein
VTTLIILGLENPKLRVNINKKERTNFIRAIIYMPILNNSNVILKEEK